MRTSNGNVTSQRLTVPVILQNFWFETISREEALRRLAGRTGLDEKLREQIKKEIPEQTLHILSFDNKTFREYVDFGLGTANLLLMLPIEKRGDKFEVIVPIHNSERRQKGRRRISGIEIVEYSFKDGMLLENGQIIEPFHFSNEPFQLMLDVSFLTPGGHPGGNWCCRACEWVHSKLNIHCADPLCCLGLC